MQNPHPRKTSFSSPICTPSGTTGNLFDTIEQIAQDAIARGVVHLSATNELLDGRSIQIEQHDLVNFGSCSYLGLEHDPAIIAGIQDAASRFGSQFSCSRSYLSIGHYETLECLLDQIFERPTIACPSTTLGHMSALPVLINDNDAIIMDQQVHHSVQTAAQLLKARGVPIHIVRHNRLDRLESLVHTLESKHRRVWYLADGVYSMYGDVAPACELASMLDRHPRLWLYIDDAHGMGWAGEHGRGYVRSQIDHHDHMILAASLNKSFAAAGGVLVLPNCELRDRIRSCGSTMIFSGPIQPPMLGAAIASARIHLAPGFSNTQAELRTRILHTNRRITELGLPQVDVSETPLFFIPTGLPRLVYSLVRRLMGDGYFVNAGVFPAVPMKQGGIRFTVHRGLSLADIDHMLERLAFHYFQVLAQESSSLADVARTFRMTGLVVPEVRTATLPTTGARSPRALRVHHATSIHNVDPTQWNRLFANQSAMTHAALAMMETVFKNASNPKQRADLGYLWIEDEHGHTVLATMYSVALLKDDMFARATVSKKIEAIRGSHDPYYLVSKTLMLGTPLSVGKHLILDRNHPRWQQALTMMIEHLQGIKQQVGASQIVLREFEWGADECLRTTMLELGFFEHRLPDQLTITGMHWSTRAEYLATLGQKYRYNVRKEAIALENKFEIETDKKCSDQTIEQCYALYCAVHARSYQLNVFRLPLELFHAIFIHPEYDIIRLYLREHPHPRKPIAVLISHRTQELYSALLVGLDERYRLSHKTYKQILFRSVERARALGATQMNLAFTADLEKKKLGARPLPTCAYMQVDDDYAAAVMNVA